MCKSPVSYQIIVKAELPGIKAENLDVSISSGNVLTIKGEKKEEKEEEAEAAFKDGVLRLSLPKTEATRLRKITVKTE